MDILIGQQPDVLRREIAEERAVGLGHRVLQPTARADEPRLVAGSTEPALQHDVDVALGDFEGRTATGSRIALVSRLSSALIFARPASFVVPWFDDAHRLLLV